MDFFTSPKDLKGWIRIQESPDSAASKILEIVGKDQEQDIVDTCRQIFKDKDEKTSDNASEVLFGVLAKYHLTQIKEGNNMNDKLKKQAQIMRQPGQYSMPLRICPKLPFSVGNKLISTYNCRHYCLDSIVFDDDPERVYCAEALWRRHVMDKFAREFKNEEGKWVGGYINSRFQVFHDDGGNQMELAHGEKTRTPRPHQYSTERRLSEGRGEKTQDITASSNKIIKLASVDDKTTTNDVIYNMFDDILAMKEAGVSDEDILYKVSDHYGKSVVEVAKIKQFATKQSKIHDGLIYSYDIKKNAQVNPNSVSPAERLTMVTKQNIQAVNMADGQAVTLQIDTPVVMISKDPRQNVLEIVDGPDVGKRVSIPSGANVEQIFGTLEDTVGKIQEAAQEVGLNDEENQGQNLNNPVEK